MKLFHPDRPRLPGTDKPLIEDTNQIVPGFYIRPIEVNTVEVLVFLPLGNNQYTHRTADMTFEALASLMKDYITNPEATLKEYFKWDSSQIKAPKQKAPSLTLEDLNLSQSLSLKDLDL